MLQVLLRLKLVEVRLVKLHLRLHVGLLSKRLAHALEVLPARALTCHRIVTVLSATGDAASLIFCGRWLDRGVCFTEETSISLVEETAKESTFGGIMIGQPTLYPALVSCDVLGSVGDH